MKVFSNSHNGKVENYKIELVKNQYTIDEEQYFENLTQLVQHYRHNADGSVSKLKEPVAKVGWGMEVSVDRKAFIEGNYTYISYAASGSCYSMSNIHYYHLQLDGVYRKVILNLELRLAKESLEVHTNTCVYALVILSVTS